MPRYYFDVSDSGGLHRDEIGDEFGTLEEAREQCHGLVADLAREELPDGNLHITTCDLRDETGRVVYRGEINFQETQDPA